MIDGVNVLADAVGATMGPGGRLAALFRAFGPVMMTKDGVTVANEVDLARNDPRAAGAELCKRVANRCNQEAGDGTTTATVLAREMINEGNKYVAAGGNPVSLKRGMDKAVKIVLEHLSEIKQPITLEDKEQVKFIAQISGNDPEVGEFVSEAFIRAGKHGVVTYEEGRTADTQIETTDGVAFDSGFISPYFVTDYAKNTCVLENPFILLWENRITSFNEILPLLQKLNLNQQGADKRPLLLICDNLEGDALATILVNVNRGAISACAVRAPAFGEQRTSQMSDLAVLTGGKHYDAAGQYKLENVNFAEVGGARRVVITQNSTTIIGGNGKPEKIEERINMLQDQWTASESPYDRDKIQARIGKLSGGVMLIKIGAHNETEMREKKFRYEDAVHATRAALEEGIVAGGGTALASAHRRLQSIKGLSEGEAQGVKVVAEALMAPVKTIANNAGYNGAMIADKLLKVLERPGKKSWGFDAATGEYSDMLLTGIVDPAKVSRLALENAVTIAGLFLLTEALVMEDPEAKEQGAPNMGGY
jgi:chaperonin GroEL